MRIKVTKASEIVSKTEATTIAFCKDILYYQVKGNRQCTLHTIFPDGAERNCSLIIFPFRQIAVFILTLYAVGFIDE